MYRSLALKSAMTGAALALGSIAAVGTLAHAANPAASEEAAAQWFQLQIRGDDHRFELRLKEGEPASLAFQETGIQGPERRYTFRVSRPLPGKLPAAAQRLNNPVAVAVRLDSKTSPQDWQLEFEQNYLIPNGTSIAVEAQSPDKAIKFNLGVRGLTPEATAPTHKQAAI